MVFALRPGLVASLAASIAMLPAVAWPCGAMVFPQHEERPGGMSDQELLVAFAADQTVLVASAGYEGIEALPQRCEVMDANVEAVKRYIAERTG